MIRDASLHRWRYAQCLMDPAEVVPHELLLPYEPFLVLAHDGVSLTFFGDQKKIWGVSVQTLARRSRDIGKLTERQYHAVFEQLARLGIPRKQESHFVPIPREKPRALRQMIERQYGVSINTRKLASDVHMTPSRLQKILAVNAEGAKPNPKVLRMHRPPAV